MAGILKTYVCHLSRAVGKYPTSPTIPTLGKCADQPMPRETTKGHIPNSALAGIARKPVAPNCRSPIWSPVRSVIIDEMARPKTQDYGWRAWAWLACSRKRAKHQLKCEPLCVMCLQKGRVTAASVADHIRAHKGNWNEFRLGALQSLCFDCHNEKGVLERGLTPRPKITIGTDARTGEQRSQA
jgi:5-methylcytosine-specific restriction endonuclease McrA